MGGDATSGQARSSAIERAVGRLMAIPRAIIATLILASIAINFANVIGRYVFFQPIVWAEEVMIFILIWCVFLGAALVAWDDRHLRMDILSLHLRSPWKPIVNTVVVVLSLVVFALVAAQSWEAVTLFARLGQLSNTAGIPMMIPHAALLAGFVLMFIAVAVRFRSHIRGITDSERDALAQRLGADDRDVER